MDKSNNPNLPKLQLVGSKKVDLTPANRLAARGIRISGTPIAPNLCNRSTSQQGCGPIPALCPRPMKDVAELGLTRQQPEADRGCTRAEATS